MLGWEFGLCTLKGTWLWWNGGRRWGEQREAPDVASGFTDCVYWAQDVINCYGHRAVWPPNVEEALWADDNPDRPDPKHSSVGVPGSLFGCPSWHPDCPSLFFPVPHALSWTLISYPNFLFLNHSHLNSCVFLFSSLFQYHPASF